MKGNRVALAFLILIAVVFVVTASMSFCGQSRESPDPESSWVSTFKDLLIREENVKLSELRSGSCLVGRTITLAQGQSCEIFILKGEARVRNFKLELVRGDQVKLDFEPAAEESLPQEFSICSQQLKSDTDQDADCTYGPEPPAMKVLKSRDEQAVEARILLRCTSASGNPAQCRLRLE